MDVAPVRCPPSVAARVPGVAAAVERRSVGLAPDDVVDARRADRKTEVVAVREGIAGRRLVRRAGPQVRETDLAAPGTSAVRGPRVPRVEAPGPVVLPHDPEVARGGSVVDLRK